MLQKALFQNALSKDRFHVIHPLDDAPEQKCQSEGLGHIKMTRGVRISLTVLRGYLFLMSGMLLYHVLNLVGILPSLR